MSKKLFWSVKLALFIGLAVPLAVQPETGHAMNQETDTSHSSTISRRQTDQAVTQETETCMQWWRRWSALSENERAAELNATRPFKPWRAGLLYSGIILSVGGVLTTIVGAATRSSAAIASGVGFGIVGLSALLGWRSTKGSPGV